jgi:hypothetical protein
LALIRALADSPRVRSLVVMPRPITIHERLLGKLPFSRADPPEKTKVFEKTALDLLRPLAGRSWARGAYTAFLRDFHTLAARQETAQRVLLDFTPIAQIDYHLFAGYRVWYDLIDDFRTHNRFTDRDREMVRHKYQDVRTHADLVTGVTSEALADFTGVNTMVVSNGIPASQLKVVDTSAAEYDLGFVGFITDKCDVEFIRTIAEDGGMSVVIHGHAYDRSVARRLRKIPNVTIEGAFDEARLGLTMSTFAVGLIPYLPDRSHHGSPIKLYQYVASGRAVVSRHPYPGETDRLGDVVTVFDDADRSRFIAKVRRLVDAARVDGLERSKRIAGVITNAFTWSAKVDLILDRIEQTQTGTGG